MHNGIRTLKNSLWEKESPVLYPPEDSATLSFGSGLTFAFKALDENSDRIVAHLRKIMRVRPGVQRRRRNAMQIEIKSAEFNRFPLVIQIFPSLHSPSAPSGGPLPDKIARNPIQETIAINIDRAACTDEMAFYCLSQLAIPVIHRVELRGGMLLHGALIEKDGCGILLAGPSEAGKTTASMRIPLPWKALSDDCTLLVRSGDRYLAHPWPTWSRFMNDQEGGTWEVERAVPLQGIFFLKKSPADQREEINSAQAACMLTESAEQASIPLELFGDIEDIRSVRTRRFDNLSLLARSVPSFLLSISMNGAFWTLLEKSPDTACRGK
jgi:SynChlorMet cassette protein ScmC